MTGEFAPRPGETAAQAIERLKQEARQRKTADLQRERAQQQAEVPVSGFRPASQPAYYAQPQAQARPQSVPRRVSSRQHAPAAPTGIPASNLPERESPVDVPVPASEAKEPVTRDIESRKQQSPFFMKSLAAAGVLGVILVGGEKIGLIDINTEQKIASGGSGNVSESAIESSYGEVVFPTVAKAEGLNIENCKKPGAAIATIMVTGQYALRYQLKANDGSVVVPEPYTAKGDLSKGAKQDPANAKFETKSGYPEMTIHNLPLEIYACEKPNAAAISQVDGVDTINAANIDFSVKLAVPAEQSNLPQTEAYMTDLDKNTVYTWPAQTFLTPNKKFYTDDSVKAAKNAHASADQQIGVFNTAVRTILASAADASTTSKFNTAVHFPDEDITTVYDAIKEGLQIRLGNDRIQWSGTIGNLKPLLSDKKPSLIDTSRLPEETFTVTEGEVVVGHYEAESRKGEKA